MFLYDSGDLKDKDARSVFDIEEASFSVTGLQEITFGPYTYAVNENTPHE